jgi:DNA-binding CsgD family transcriptional regulator
VHTLLERERELGGLEGLLQRESGVLVIEGGAGIGKSSLIEATCRRAAELQYRVLRASGSELEADFAFGVVRQLFERRLAEMEGGVRDALLDGPAAAARPLLLGRSASASTSETSSETSPEAFSETVSDTFFAVVHGLYWLALNFAVQRPVLIVVDDAHWADEPSLRWLAYLARRLEGLSVVLAVALRPNAPAAVSTPLLDVRAAAALLLRPALLSEDAVGHVVRASAGAATSDAVCSTLYAASGGNPLYLTELLRAVNDGTVAGLATGMLPSGGVEGIARRVVARVRGVAPRALELAQALAVLGDQCEMRHAAGIAGLMTGDAARLAAALVRVEVLASDDPPRFMHPVIRAAIEASLAGDERDAAHRAAARLLHDEGAPPGKVAAHLVGVQCAGDGWVLARLEDAAQVALESGAPGAAAGLLGRALAEPPSAEDRVRVLRAAARAEASAGWRTACAHLEEALQLVELPRERAELALEIAETYSGLFRWVDAVDILEQALTTLDDTDDVLAARLEGELVVAGMHDARRAGRVAPILLRPRAQQLEIPSEPFTVARAMAAFLAGRPAEEIAASLEEVLMCAGRSVENWDTRAALLWVLIATERFGTVESSLASLLSEVHRSGSARGFVAAYSTLGLLELRRGDLADADAAARIALRVIQEGDFAPGLAFAVTVLADVAVEAGEYDEAQTLLDLLPQDGWPAGVGTVLIPAARGRLRLAQGRADEALRDFEACLTMFDAQVWGMSVHETGYVHARSGAARALQRLGELPRAVELADAELADARVFGAPRALGVALRAAGLVRGEERGLQLLDESQAVLRSSPALLERAHSLVELGAALRRAGQRAAARAPLGESLELAARCGARPLAARAREELKATGARPRRDWRTGLEALTPSELRVARLAAEGRSNRAIAQELYVTLKTVEGHLAHVYAKLEIDGRTELARVLGGQKTRVATL